MHVHRTLHVSCITLCPIVTAQAAGQIFVPCMNQANLCQCRQGWKEPLFLADRKEPAEQAARQTKWTWGKLHLPCHPC